MTFKFTDNGFRPSYEVEINPEYPATGDWGIPEFRFGTRSGIGTFRAGDTLTLRIRPEEASPWVALFAVLDPEHYANGLFACPNPGHLLVAAGTVAYLLDVTEPGAGDDLPIGPVMHVQRPSGLDLLLIGSFTKLAAVDVAGLRWVTGRLFLDDLELVHGQPGKICVQGSVGSIPGDPELLTIDPSRGDLMSGPRYTDSRHPAGEPGWRRPGV
ncbi:MAG TPA: hypothetical protein VND96_09875 [Candidatus Micrarchaeaceae archaeon]|nr:hypothetical protein [Candidatus Micrarchaeaceae archaeon]